MSADEYWYQDPSLIYVYQEAFALKQKYDVQMAWTQGAYFKSALASTLVWATLPEKTSDLKKMPKYEENPYDRLQNKSEPDEEKQRLMDAARARLSELGLLGKQKLR